MLPAPSFVSSTGYPTDDGRDTEEIGTCHKPYNNNDEPTISSSSGKAGFEVEKFFLNKF